MTGAVAAAQGPRPVPPAIGRASARARNGAAHIYGWLLLLPAAVLLGSFTHFPAVATFIESFYSTPRGARPARFVGANRAAVPAPADAPARDPGPVAPGDIAQVGGL